MFLFSCNMQKEMNIKRIIIGFLVEENYFCEDHELIYFTDTDTIAVRSVNEYDNAGNLIKYIRFASEDYLEYSIDDLMNDTLLLQLVGGKSAKVWKFIENNKITNNADTLEIETTKNNLGMNIFINRKGNSVTIFEFW